MPFFAYDEPVNEGERRVARELRNEFGAQDSGWFVISNVEFPDQHNRWPECDAIALSSSGYGYLIEVKAWAGPIRGNDSQWLMPSLSGHGHWVQTAPVVMTSRKAKKLGSWIATDTGFRGFFIQHVVVVADPLGADAIPPDFPEGTKSHQYTVMAKDLLNRLEQDPRSDDFQRSNPVEPDAAHEIYDLLCSAVRPINATTFGDYELEDLEEERTDGTEVWAASSTILGANKKYRLKRFPLDQLADDEERAETLARATHDANVLHHLVLTNPDLVVPHTVNQIDSYLVMVAPYQEDQESFLNLLLGDNPVSAEIAYEYSRLVLKALSDLHVNEVVHRNIRPIAIWLVKDKVKFTDFDFARMPELRSLSGALNPDDLDADYAAPEVRADPSAASQKSDLYSVAKVLSNLWDRAEGSVTGGERLSEALSRCLAESPEERPRDASEVYESLGEPTESPWPFIVGDTLDRRYVVYEVKEGGLSYVYRVFDSITEQVQSAKFIKPAFIDVFDPVEEYRITKDLNHPNVVTPKHIETMERVRRKGQPGQHQAFSCSFMLMSWVEGKDLGEFLGRRLSPARITQIGIGILDGLTYLHGQNQPIIHRDIKLGNVLIEDESETVKIIDFNVSTNALEDVSILGTPGYKAPEVRATEPWTTAADVWSTGVCLVELLAGSPLADSNDHSKPSAWLEDNRERFSVSLTSLLIEMLDDRPDCRPSAMDAAARLKALLEEPPVVQVPHPPDAPPVSVGNRYVTEIMKFFSQADNNSGTRWFDDPFKKWLYVETDLDQILRPEIIKGSFALVIITGNAGDGKTAFLRNLEKKLLEDHEAKLGEDPQVNGSTLTTADRTYHTNWDGSQDADGTKNEEVLSTFFEPFQGCGDSNPTPGETALIAINEGRLVDFLAEHREIHPDLERHVDELLRGGKDGVPSWLTLINLNKRTLTGPGPNNLVGQLASRLSDDRLWEECTGCAAFDRCPTRTNAETFRHPILGQRVIERVRETLDVVRLRGRIHLTTRDLMSALSFLFTGNRTCRQLIDSFEQEDHRALLDGQLYNRLFAGTQGGDPVARKDRLVRELGYLDVAQRPQPEIDGRLWLQKTTGLHPVPDGAPTSDRKLIDRLIASEPSEDEDTLRYAHASLRRKLYAESQDPDVLKMLPYEYLRGFLSLLKGQSDELETANSEISEAISASEGLPGNAESVAVRLVSELKSRDRSFVTQPADDFQTTAFDEGAGSEFFEHHPRLLRFTSRENPTLELDINVDVYEVLMRMRAGYTPSREDLRGAWLSLESFKQRVAAMSSMELLLRSRDGHRYRISVNDAGRIHARSVL